MKCSSGGGSSGGAYVLETTENYTDWYKRDADGTYLHTNGYYYSYGSTIYNGSSVRWVWVSGSGDYTNYSYSPDGPASESSGSYPDYNGTRINSWTIDTVLFTNLSDPIISDITQYLECFSLDSGAILTIYVDQPTANSDETWSTSFSTGVDVGHTFISISQNGITRVLGYYPTPNTISPLSGVISSSAVIRNNEGHEYDVSITSSINASQLSNIIDSMSNFNSTYNLNTYNCTDFGISIANSTGMNLTDTSGTWPGNGNGSNPGNLGNLGQDIRAKNLSSGITTNSVGGNAPQNNGTCK